MKKLYPSLAIVCFCILISTSLTFGQDDSYLSHKTLQFKGETSTKEITMPLRDSLEYLTIKVNGMVKNGELTIEVFNPNGERCGNFSIVGTTNNPNANEDLFRRGKSFIPDASGNLVRTIKNPPSGIWKAKVDAKNAVGGITILFSKEVVLYKIE